MEIFNRFNRKSIQDRQIDTLIGLSKGLTADGKVDQGEAEFFLSWLIQNKGSTESPIILNLLEKVAAVLKNIEFDGATSHDPSSRQSSIFNLPMVISGTLHP